MALIVALRHYIPKAPVRLHRRHLRSNLNSVKINVGIPVILESQARPISHLYFATAFTANATKAEDAPSYAPHLYQQKGFSHKRRRGTTQNGHATQFSILLFPALCYARDGHI